MKIVQQYRPAEKCDIDTPFSFTCSLSHPEWRGQVIQYMRGLKPGAVSVLQVVLDSLRSEEPYLPQLHGILITTEGLTLAHISNSHPLSTFKVMLQVELSPTPLSQKRSYKMPLLSLTVLAAVSGGWLISLGLSPRDVALAGVASTLLGATLSASLSLP